ncbi:hypothetical protein ACQR1I_05255 [Bradyrhizobium sp. HKCCYLS2038]|uniref:hypothetical protein n=1 Tax=unclassified Bradyrhizobium TaxID=2631580 RepID=UPI003EBB86D2
MTVWRVLRGQLLPVASGLLGANWPPRAALACSLVDVKEAVAEAIASAQAWWVASAVVAIGIVIVEVGGRRRSLPLLAAPLLVAFHPAWWGGPSYGPDCSFAIVEASHVVFAVLLVMLCCTLFLAWRARRRG